jgi:thioredoxin reductase (NADPH)
MEEREIIILGSGVAGLAAAIYNARAELKPLVLTGVQDGGQIGTTTMVENFPGFPEGILGPELVQRMRKQAEKFGAEVRYEGATTVERLPDGSFTLTTEAETYHTKAIIVATGATARWLDLPDEERFRSNGVHTCATCDGAFYKGKTIFIVGGGDAACEEAHFLAKFATKVTMLVRGDSFRASLPMQERIKSDQRIHVRYNSEIVAYRGEASGLTGVRLRDTKTGKEADVPIDGVFLAIGHVPNTTIFKGMLEMDELGYLKVNQKTETNVPGIFAAGDVADRTFRQAITAAGTGAAASIAAERYLAARRH